MGFIPDIKRIMALLPAAAKRQNLLFSATFSNEIKKLADQLLNAPELIEVARRNTAAETVDAERRTSVRRTPSARCSRRSCGRASCARCSASCAPSTAPRASRASSRRMASRRRRSTATRRRARASMRSQAFKEGKLEVLVATDVAARGLDVDDLPLVVNYELPHVARGLHPSHRPHRPRGRHPARRSRSWRPKRKSTWSEIERLHEEEDRRAHARRLRSGRRRCAHAAARAQRTSAPQRTPREARGARREAAAPAPAARTSIPREAAAAVREAAPTRQRAIAPRPEATQPA